MASPILPVSSPVMPALDGPSRATSGGGAFSDVFSQAVRSVEAADQEGSASVERFLSGDGEDLHSTILATTRAELSFDLFLQARNEVVSAYQEIMRMQL
jgi:flagellar hook-basal body complex protein FliE